MIIVGPQNSDYVHKHWVQHIYNSKYKILYFFQPDDTIAFLSKCILNSDSELAVVWANDTIECCQLLL